MLKLGKRNEGRWFDVPGKYFEKDKVRLHLKMVTEDQVMKLSKMDVIPNKVTGIPSEKRNIDRIRKDMYDILSDACLDWEGIEEDFSKDNFKIFLSTFGNIVVGKTMQEVKVSEEGSATEEKEVDQVFSNWMMKTVRDAEIMLPNDIENLQNTSEV